jgi:Uma2 family endonuclease
MRGEILEGVLYTQPKIDAVQQALGATLLGALREPFQRGRAGGPGGWWLLQDPRIRLPESDFTPDLAAWRIDRVPNRPTQRDKITVAPDWVCEIHSAATRGYDFLIKRAFYARTGVGALWYIDPDVRTLLVSKLVRRQWVEVGVYGNDDEVRVDPFEEHAVACGAWWKG